MLTCGVAVRVITPENPIALAGYASRWGKKSCGVHDDIFVKAFMFDDQATRMLMIFADVEGLKDTILDNVRKRIEEELGISKVSFSATHNHSAPHTYPQVQLDEEEMDAEWVSLLTEQLFCAAQEATRNTFVASIGNGSIAVPEVARNRRKGQTLTDPILYVLRIDDADGNVRGVILTYSCHCTVLDGNSFLITSDYPGAIYRQLQQEYPGCVCAFSNGAAGDVNIGYSSDASALGITMDIRTFENAEKIADIISSRAVECMKEMVMLRDVPVDMELHKINLPLKDTLPDEVVVRENIQELDRQIEVCSDASRLRELKLEKIYQQCVVLRIHGIEKNTTSIEATIAFIRFGDRLFITIPGELFTEPGMILKEKFKPEFQPAIIGYSNGYVGYLPSRSAMMEGGYEAETSIFAVNIADAIVEQITELKAGLFARAV